MCGIAGYAGYFDRKLLTEMCGRIQHRGPDDFGTIFIPDGNHLIGLGHQRLSIIDLSSTSKQPMTVTCSICQVERNLDDKKKIWLSYNGELYNYRELRQDLVIKGHQFQTQSDTEVIIHMYAEYGLDMLSKLNGMFAFALYDGRTSGQKNGVKPGDLILVRDALGVKPLYYAESRKGVLFSSELKAILADPEIDKTVDHTAIHYYLAYLSCPAPHTPLVAIKKVEPGQAFIIRNRAIVKKWYFYDLSYENIMLSRNENDLVDELAQKFENAVNRQMVADVPVGAFLSGGLDSSAIVAMMKKHNPKEFFKCYSIGFKGDNFDKEGYVCDLPYAKKVAEHLKVDLRVLEINANVIQHLEEMLYYLDEPQADPAPINALLIARAAREDGMKVLMSGAGGDDIFSGYRRHQALQMEHLWTWLPRPFRSIMGGVSRQLSEGRGFIGVKKPILRRLTKLFSYIDSPPLERIVSYFYWGTEGLRRSLYTKEMSLALSDINTATPLLNSLNRNSQISSPLNQMLYLECKHFLADHNLNYTDKVTMAAGVETRVPFLDLELVEYVNRLPVQLKIKNNQCKFILKKAMERYLPRDVIYRPKTGFGAPLRQWLHGDLKPLINDVLSEEAMKKRGFFDHKALNQLIKKDKKGQVDAAYTIFSVLCIELWMRKFQL